MTSADVDDGLSAPARSGLSALQLVLGAVTGVGSFAGFWELLWWLHERNVDGAMLNMMILPGVGASVVLGVVVARRVRALQTRRLTAALEPTAPTLPSSSSSQPLSSTGVRS